MNLISRRKFNAGALAGIGVASAGLAGVGRALAAEHINFQANWLNDPEFIGYMIAIDNGYYADEGLDVTYLSGGPNLIPEGSLLSGKSDIALTSMLTTAKAIVEQQAPFKIVGAQYQKSPIGIISLEATGIKGPKDLVGKTVAVPALSANQFAAMLKINGVAADQVKVVPFTFDPTPLIKGEVDAVIDFVTQTPFLVEQASGQKVSYFLTYDVGLPFFIDMVVVTEDTLKARRADVVKFLRASRKGWLENFADATKYPKLYHDTWFKGLGSTIEAETYFNNVQLDLMSHPDGIYTMSADGIQRNLETLAKLDVKASADMYDTSLLAEI